MTRFLALSFLFGACGDNLTSPFADPPSIAVVSMPVSGGNVLDILFVIDDSPGVAHIQNSLAEGADALLQPLDAVTDGRLDLHLGTTTSDFGTTALRDSSHPGPAIGQIGNGGCAGAGKDGALVLSSAPVVGSYLIDGPTTNYMGSRHDVLGQMFKVGSGGCGFEQPLAASVRAFANPANVGFRRDGGNLLVIFIQDEDDCTLLDTQLLGPSSEELGPLQSFRCTRFGVQCDEDLSSVGPKHNCGPRHDSPFVLDVDALPDEYRSLVTDPARLVVGVVAGPTEPVGVELILPPGGIPPLQEQLVHACAWIRQDGDLAVADPPVRMQSVVEMLGAHGSLTSVCSADLRPSLTELARVAKQMFGVACLDTSKLRDSDTAAGVQPTCTATLVAGSVEEPLPACPTDGACFQIVSDAAACAETGDHLRFVVHDAPVDAYIRARCEVP